MFRINVHIDEQAVTLEIEGRLAGSAIPEAEQCWRAARVEYPDRPLRVDLRSVTFIDRDGIALVKQAYGKGASFLASGCLTRAYVEEVTRSRHKSTSRKRSFQF